MPLLVVITAHAMEVDFDREGKVLNGPAPRDLPWLAMELTPDGALLIDRYRMVTPNDILEI